MACIILQTIDLMKSGFHGNHINLQTMHFHSICDNVWRHEYLFTFCIGFTYLLYFKSSIMLGYDFYLNILSPYLSKKRYHGNLQFVALCTVMCK